MDRIARMEATEGGKHYRPFMRFGCRHRGRRRRLPPGRARDQIGKPVAADDVAIIGEAFVNLRESLTQA